MQTHALRIQELALMIPEAFTLDTRGFDLQTEALDTIRTKKERFNAEARQLGAAAAALAGSLRSRDAYTTSAALGNVISACRNCHDFFRAEPKFRE